MKKAILFLVAYLFIQVVCTVPFTLYSSFVDGGQMSTTMITASSAFSNIVAVLIFGFMKWHPFSLDYLKTKPWVTLYWTILVTLGMLLPSTFLEELIPESLTQDIIGMNDLLGSAWAPLAICIMAPIAEEVVCRGAIQNALVKYFADGNRFNNRFLSNPVRHRWAPLIITALIFSAIHGNPAQMPHAFLIGLLLSWLAYRTGSIVPGILLHAVNNSLAFVIYHIYPESADMHLIEFFGDSWLRLGGAVALSLLIFIPALYQLNKHLTITHR